MPSCPPMAASRKRSAARRPAEAVEPRHRHFLPLMFGTTGSVNPTRPVWIYMLRTPGSGPPAASATTTGVTRSRRLPWVPGHRLQTLGLPTPSALRAGLVAAPTRSWRTRPSLPISCLGTLPDLISDATVYATVTSADLLLHPVRLRIVQAFLGDRALTTSDLRSELPDVPPASLYRHVARLVDAGVLAVVAERRVRGAVERTYVLRGAAARISLGELAMMSLDEHRQAFMAFVAALLGDFDRYLARSDIDVLRDGASYQMAGMWLDDAEFADLLRDLARVLQPRLANAPKAGRRRRILGSVLLPGENAPG